MHGCRLAPQRKERATGSHGLKFAISIALLAAVLGGVLIAEETDTLAEALSAMSPLPLAAAVMALTAGVLLSSLRLKLMAADLGFVLSFRNAALAQSVGQISGAIFFQFAGQLVGRSAVLSRCGIPPAATVVLSTYERITATASSLLLAGAGALYLFGTIGFNLHDGGISLIKLAAGLCAAIAAGAALAWGETVLDIVRSITRDHARRALRGFVVSLGVQLATLAAYVALERTVAPDIDVASLAAASVIVMLAASLPISLGGWGLRELSAVVALQAVGLPSASALLVAITIGLLSLGVTAATALAAMIAANTEHRPAELADMQAPGGYAAALDWSLPIMAVTAVFFQVHLPIANTLLSVNLADPIVLVAAALFALRLFGSDRPRWRVPYIPWVALAATIAILSSFAAGWISFGWSDWAFANRLLGWPMLLCYGATGALIAYRAGSRGFDLALTAFAATGAALVLLDIASATSARLGLRSLDGLVGQQISGFSQNPNAFAFLLILAVASSTVMTARAGVRIGLMSIAMLGLWLAGSRAGLATLPIIVIAGWLMGSSVRLSLVALLAAAIAVFAVEALPKGAYLAGLSEASPSIGAIGRDDPESLRQHWETVQQGFSMFLVHPVFGAGLGAYLHEQLEAGKAAVLIHSTPVWLLAETGIAGFAVFFIAACKLLALGFRFRQTPWGRLLVLMLCGMASMSLVHELLYQRGFWILLGMTLMLPAGLQPDDPAEKYG